MTDQWIIGKEFRFEAAHELPHHQGKCARLHGHSWRGVVYVSGSALCEDGSASGMVIDFAEIKQVLKPLLDDYLDHHFLNKTTGLENPTSEAIARWIFEQLEQRGLPGLLAVRIDETCTSTCVYTRSPQLGLQLITAGNAVIVR
jgi:6-pyruvoyltetrahydropterin/6-carboxytetrahydropterin synthase